ncbi:MAG: hypothetical protein AVDCRST_MAG48-364 [uncultured Friedmanniella sp.]|uniref:Uncharacterized protein n=1 Tax=uncultured Friedmanniella sp. TaxID=335381 RepID=A0A6J4JW44_9ACTN|nr:MAG: hypothetical protein AVDCRST_MAG48-364 [uncultured Friedmanniella sp.]
MPGRSTRPDRGGAGPSPGCRRPGARSAASPGTGDDLAAPFDGYERSGNGRWCGELAFHEFLQTKAVMGYGGGRAA